MDNNTKHSLIRIFANDGSIAGVGFLVSDRHALSCAHVVAAAIPSCECTSQVVPIEKVKIDFPFSAPGKYLWLTVTHWLPVKNKDGQPSGDEDIAILRINDDDSINDECQSVDLLPIDDYNRISFESYGFPKDNSKNQLTKGIQARGETFGDITEGCVAIQNTNINSKGYFVEPGFSGAPILNNKTVIGMVVRADIAHSTAYMLPSNILIKACFEHISRLTPESSKELVGLLKDISQQSWLRIYSRYSDDKTSRPPANVYLAVMNLLRLTDQQQGLQFIYDLGYEFEQQTLVDWVSKHYPKKLTQIKAKASRKIERITLLFLVEPDPNGTESFRLHYWSHDGGSFIKESDNDPEPKTLQVIYGEIQETVTVARSIYPDMVVELVLPRNEFSLDLAQWKTQSGDTFLQNEAFVVLRCLKRFMVRRMEQKIVNNGKSLLRERLEQKNTANSDPNLVRLGDWRVHSLTLKEYAKMQAGQVMFTLTPQNSRSDLIEELWHKKKGVFVVCGFDSQIAHTTSALCIALDYGVPLAIWFRELPDGVLYDDAKLLEMMGLNAGITLEAIPEHIWNLQRKALNENKPENPLYHLTILYDDYESVPQW